MLSKLQKTLKNFQWNCGDCTLCCHFPDYFEENAMIPLQEVEQVTGIESKTLDFLFQRDNDQIRYQYTCKNYEKKQNGCQKYQEKPLLCDLFPIQIYQDQDEILIAISQQCPLDQEIIEGYQAGKKEHVELIEVIKNSIDTLELENAIFDFEHELVEELVRIPIKY
ncbi:MAG: Fe-S-cluster containining protein [bacterium]|jgi:Fe-S-cluster containining protein